MESPMANAEGAIRENRLCLHIRRLLLLCWLWRLAALRSWRRAIHRIHLRDSKEVLSEVDEAGAFAVLVQMGARTEAQMEGGAETLSLAGTMAIGLAEAISEDSAGEAIAVGCMVGSAEGRQSSDYAF